MNVLHRNIQNQTDFIEFIDLLEIDVPSEEKEDFDVDFNYDSEEIIIKDDSSIRLHDFNEIREIYNKYPSTLLADYLSYLI